MIVSLGIVPTPNLHNPQISLMELGIEFDDPAKARQNFILKTCFLYVILIFSGIISTAFVKQRLRRSLFEKSRNN